MQQQKSDFPKVPTGREGDGDLTPKIIEAAKTQNGTELDKSMFLNVDKLARNRTGSVSSGVSNESEYLSPGTLPDATPTKTKLNSTIRTLNERNLTELLTLIYTTATKMAEAVEKQKQTNMTVKTGIKTILEATDVALHRHGTTRSKTSNIVTDVEMTENETDTETDRSTKRKRDPTESSPKAPSKRASKDGPAGPWQTVKTKKKTETKRTEMHETDKPKQADTSKENQTKRRRTNTKTRGTAILVKPGQDKTYSDIVRQIRTVNPNEKQVTITTVRKTKDGACLIKMQTGTDGRGAFKDAIKAAIGDTGSVRDMSSRVQLDIMDLDCVVTESDVTEALKKETGRDGNFKVHIFGPNRAEQYMAACELESHEAEALLGRGRIAIGWVRCRIRRRLTVTRCYRCLGYGHTKTDCNGKDRTKCCRRCGQEGHYATNCTSRPACFLCMEAKRPDVEHLVGTGLCPVFRAALEECRKQAGRNAPSAPR